MKSQKKNNKHVKWFYERPKLTGIITFLFLSYIVGFIVFQQYKLAAEDNTREMTSILHVVRQNIEQSLKNCYTTTLSLALTIDDSGYPTDFDTISKALIEANENITTVELVPNGVIKYIYPLDKNQEALNLNILQDNNLKKEALKSIATHKMYFAGPLKLRQGGEAIVGRLPIFIKSKFWGFSAVVIDLEKLLNSAGISNIDSSKYYFQFSKLNLESHKETFHLSNKADFTNHANISVKIPDGDWKLYIISKKENNIPYQILVPGIIGIILAALFGILIFTLLRMPNELQSLVVAQAKKLMNSEIKFETIFDQAAVGIAHVDSFTGRFIQVNNQYCKLLGYTQQEIQELNYQTLTHPDDLNDDLTSIDKLRDGQITDYSREKRYISKDGTVIWINLTVSPLIKTDGKVISHIAIIEDISIKKEAEQLIKKSEIRFKSLFEDYPIALWEKDFSLVRNYLVELDLMHKSAEEVKKYLGTHPEVVIKAMTLIRVIDVNTMCMKLHNAENKEELTVGFQKLIGERYSCNFANHILAITQGENEIIAETIIKTAHGEPRDVKFRWSVISGFEESLARTIVSTEDITVQKQSENIIKKSQQRVESLINTIDGIVWEFDTETDRYNFVSKKIESILGYTAEEWISNSVFWPEHIHPDDKDWVVKYCENQTDAHLNHDFEYRMIKKDGTIVWLRDIVNVVVENGKPATLRGIMIDVTKTKEAEKDLNASFDLVSEQNKRLLNFSYIISHNLRSHTSNIASIVSLIESSESEEERNDMMELLKTVSRSLNETMLHLNEVINIRTNISLVSESLNLEDNITRVTNILSKQINSNEVTIITEIPKDTVINYNPAYLESILYNIILNSIRYKHPNRKPLIKITFTSENNVKILKISDNGIGIDLDRNGDKVFGMYKTFTDNSDSKGIGLFITKNQIDAMGGNITVESEINIGTTFKIYIL